MASRAFEGRFQLADSIEAGNVTFQHGLLSIELRRVVDRRLVKLGTFTVK